MKILVLGAAMGLSGRLAIKKHLSKIISENELLLTILYLNFRKMDNIWLMYFVSKTLKKNLFFLYYFPFLGLVSVDSSV